MRWCKEKADKATAPEDRAKFQWLDGYLRGRLLHTITRDEIQAIGEAKAGRVLERLPTATWVSCGPY